MQNNTENKYYKSEYHSPLGKITICCDNYENIIGLWLEGQKHFGSTVNISKADNVELNTFKHIKNWLGRYFNGENPDIKELRIKPIGNDFRQQVWKNLCKIPYGTVTTYGNIAKNIANERNIKKMSPQAIGNAIGHNPILIIVPCHRVISANGNLTGYSAGINTKIKLLELEGIDIKNYKKYTF